MRDIMRLLETVNQNIFYHVTFATRVPAILDHGIVIGKRRNWKSQMGSRLGDRKLIYLFGDTTSAVRWAASMEYDFERPTTIIEITDPPGLIRPDDHIQMQMGGYKAFTTDEAIPASHIRRAIPLTREMVQALVKDRHVDL